MTDYFAQKRRIVKEILTAKLCALTFLMLSIASFHLLLLSRSHRSALSYPQLNACEDFRGHLATRVYVVFNCKPLPGMLTRGGGVCSKDPQIWTHLQNQFINLIRSNDNWKTTCAPIMPCPRRSASLSPLNLLKPCKACHWKGPLMLPCWITFYPPSMVLQTTPRGS